MKTYKCRCHVCGNEFDHAADFISCGSYADGTLRISCNVEASTGVQHTAAEIRAAWKGESS